MDEDSAPAVGLHWRQLWVGSERQPRSATGQVWSFDVVTQRIRATLL